MAIIDINNLSNALDAFYSKMKNNFAPKSHASTATTYGVSSASNYGHAMASGTTPKANGTAAVGSETAKFARGDHVHPLQTTVSGNAGTATRFASAQSITLTGDVTGSASSQAGWSIVTTLKNSGVTAGSYGPSANASPAHSGTFSVPYITVDAKGRITAASTKTITLPADNNTDTKVTYTLGTTTKYYMGGPTATETGTGGITFDTGIYATTTAGQLSVGSLQSRGTITTSGNVTLQHGTANIEAQYVAKRTDTGVGVYMGVGSGGTNHGVYSQKLSKWMVYADASSIYLQGNADTATKLKTTRTIKIGNKSLNFDGSAALTYTLDDMGVAAKSHGTHLTIGTGAGNAAAGNHSHTQFSGEILFTGSGAYTDPWNGTGCAIKATGNIGCTGGLRANGGVATCASPCGAATSDGATYVGNFRYAQNRGYCDIGNNGIPGRLYIRSGQGANGSGVYVECQVTNGNAYLQYLSPEAGTIALTSHLSDRTRKDNIVYIDSEESEFTTKDFYDFIRDDLGLATYTLKESYAATDTHTKLNFIAQDILWDYNKNEEHKVGNLIVQAANAMEEQLSLKFDPDNYVSVIAGALKESINKIEELEDKNKKLEERLAMLEEKFSTLENK
jgi:hypothetical protein